MQVKTLIIRMGPQRSGYYAAA